MMNKILIEGLFCEQQTIIFCRTNPDYIIINSDMFEKRKNGKFCTSDMQEYMVNHHCISVR